MSTDNTERREYFRVTDNAIVSLSKLKNNQTLIDLKKQNSTFILGSEIANIDTESQALFNNLKRNQPDIARYLDTINKKINLISEHLLESSMDSNDDKQQEIKIDLSASGIAITTSEDYSEGDTLIVKLLLLPEKKGIVCIGKVIRTKNCEQETTLCIDFTDISELDRELIIKHTISKQLQEARNKKDLQDQQ